MISVGLCIGGMRLYVPDHQECYQSSKFYILYDFFILEAMIYWNIFLLLSLDALSNSPSGSDVYNIFW